MIVFTTRKEMYNMITLLGSLGGIIVSLIPEFFNFIKDKKDKEHELKFVKLQIQASKNLTLDRLEEVKIDYNLEEAKILYKHASRLSIPWIDSLSALVRPFLTFSFMALYVLIKLIVIFNYREIAANTPIWSSEDEGLFSVVIGFWFGARMFNKYRKNAC